MPRRVVWLSDLASIREAIDRSNQAQYSREDIEKLLQIQSRAANLVMGLLPTTKVGTSYLVEHHALTDFLAQLNAAKDPASELKRIEKLRTRRNTLKQRLPAMLQTSRAPLRVDALPHSVSLTKGRLQIECPTVEDLLTALYALASIVEHDLGTLIELFEEQPQQATDDGGQDEMAAMWDDLERMEKEYAARKAQQNES